MAQTLPLCLLFIKSLILVKSVGMLNGNSQDSKNRDFTFI